MNNDKKGNFEGIRHKRTTRVGLWLSLLGGTLLLASCGGLISSTKTKTPSSVPTAVLNGQIDSWTPSEPLAKKVMPDNAIIEQPVAKDFSFAADVNQQNGTFKMILPDSDKVKVHYQSDMFNFTNKSMFAGCSESHVTTEPGNVSIIPLNKLITDTGKSLVSIEKNGVTYNTFWYSDKDVTINIDVKDCVGFHWAKNTIKLKAGWNYVEQKLITHGSNTQLDYSVKEIDWQKQTFKWQAFNQDKHKNISTMAIDKNTDKNIKPINLDFLTPWKR